MTELRSDGRGDETHVITTAAVTRAQWYGLPDTRHKLSMEMRVVAGEKRA